MTFLAISFHGTHMNSQRSLWKKHQLQASSNRAMSAAQPGCQPYIGGTFVLYDWERDRVIWQLAVDGAMGYCLSQEKLYINMLRFGEILVLDGYGHELQRISHPSFNDLHSILPGKRGFLITSTGIDAIIEIARDGTLLYEWNALENAAQFLCTPPSHTLDRTLDQRYMLYPTTMHITHVNSARFSDAREDVILATFFTQGTIVAIERSTQQVQTLVRGLSMPHDLRPYRDGSWIVSDTGNNRTLVLDRDWQISRCIALDFDWVQSSAPLSDGSIVIADANHHRLVRVDPDNPDFREIRTFSPDWRIYQVEEVLPEQRTFFRV